jgi:hypothetical protein
MDSAIVVARKREDVVVGSEIVRHRLFSRLMHWTVALTFFVALLTGLPIWTPVFGWMAHLFGGLSVARLVHPWAGVAFFLAAVVQFFEWISDMRVEPGRGTGSVRAFSGTCGTRRTIRARASTTAGRSCISGP